MQMLPYKIKRKIFYICLCVMGIFIAHLAKPFIEKRYASNYEYMIIAALICYLLFVCLYIAERVKIFLREDYVFYKTTGASTGYIIRNFVKNNWKAFIAFLIIFDVIVAYDNSFGSFIMINVQFVIVGYIYITFLYVKEHFPRWNKLINLILCFFAAAELIRIVIAVSDNMTQDMSGAQILINVCRMVEIKGIWAWFSAVNIYRIIIEIFISVAGCCMLVLTENPFAEPIRVKHHWKRFPLVLRKKGNVLGYLLIYGLYIFIMAKLLDKNQNAFVVISIIAILMLVCAADSIYREDIGSKMWYRVLGESYTHFIIGKLYISELLCVPAVIVSIMVCALDDLSWISELLVLVVGTFLLIYWNLYYSWMYWRMHALMNGIEFLMSLLFFALLLIPFVNIITCILLYTNGKAQWNKYVEA